MNKANDYPYLKHIDDAIDKIKAFTEGVSFDDFSSNDMLQSAVIRDSETIWGTIYDDLPKLKRQIDMIINNFESL